jgi:predicted Ser/Thr protein kinase
MADEPSTDTLLGTLLAGSYRIERKLAEGGMGVLYEARHERLGMSLAVKTLQHDRANRPEAIERARREALALASLASPNVVRIVDFVSAPDGRPCLVTELLAGQDLGERIGREKKLSVGEAVRIARATTEGLAEAHRRGVLHRDLKPSNVFLTSEGDVKLIDFGVAKLDEETASLTHAGSFLGTPAYMSPEQAAHASKIDERSDIYGVGAMLYHALSGRPPYGAELDATQTLMRLLAGEPPRLSTVARTIPEGLAACVEKAMSRDPADRFPSARAFADELARFETGTTDPAAEQEARFARPAAIALVLATAVLASLWSAAVCAEIGTLARAFTHWPDWTLVLYRTIPAIVLVFGLGSGATSIWNRWRSGPRIQALLVGLRRTVWISAAALGVVATGRIAVTLYPVENPWTETEVSLGALLGAVLLAATLAAIGARLRRRAGVPA